jgi:hypothetical protein
VTSTSCSPFTKSCLNSSSFANENLISASPSSVVGQFLFELHGSETTDTHHALLVTYNMICTDINEDCKPLPPNSREEWGPGEDTKDMGMVALTHRKGQVEADDGDAEIKFSYANIIRLSLSKPISKEIDPSSLVTLAFR